MPEFNIKHKKTGQEYTVIHNNPNFEAQNILGAAFNVPGATSRSAIRANPALALAGPLAGLLGMSGAGGAQTQQAAGQGALNPSSVQTFQDQAIQAGQNAFGGPSTSVGMNFLKGLIPSAAGLAADVVTDPTQVLLALVGGKALPKDVPLPQFKSTEDAVSFGIANKNNKAVLSKLTAERNKILEQSKQANKLYAEGKLTDQQYQQAINKGFQAQLHREALEGASGKITKEDIERNRRLLTKRAVTAGAVGAVAAGSAEASEDVDMNKIYQIESNNNPMAINQKTQAMGLGQLRPDVLKEFNDASGLEFTSRDLLKADINRQVSEWYMQQRIPQMLQSYEIPDTQKNRILSYNWGIGNVKKWIDSGADESKIPKETLNYLKKYGIKS